jgi:hypothetical protein
VEFDLSVIDLHELGGFGATDGGADTRVKAANNQAGKKGGLADGGRSKEDNFGLATANIAVHQHSECALKK